MVFGKVKIVLISVGAEYCNGVLYSSFFNPRRACAARVTVVVTSPVIDRVKNKLSSGRRSENVGFSLKLLCSKVMA